MYGLAGMVLLASAELADSSTEIGSSLGLSFMWPLFLTDRCLAWEISFFGIWHKYKRISKGWGCLLRLRQELIFLFFISTLFNQPKQVIYFSVKSRTETAFVGRTATVKPSQDCICDSVDEVREHRHNTLSVPSQTPATHCNGQRNLFWLQNVSESPTWSYGAVAIAPIRWR